MPQRRARAQACPMLDSPVTHWCDRHASHITPAEARTLRVPNIRLKPTPHQRRRSNGAGPGQGGVLPRPVRTGRFNELYARSGRRRLPAGAAQTTPGAKEPRPAAGDDRAASRTTVRRHASTPGVERCAAAAVMVKGSSCQIRSAGVHTTVTHISVSALRAAPPRPAAPSPRPALERRRWRCRAPSHSPTAWRTARVCRPRARRG